MSIKQILVVKIKVFQSEISVLLPNYCLEFQQQQIAAIQESKLSKKSKVGVIPFVHNFEVSILYI